jgi:hypothetical protein
MEGDKLVGRTVCFGGEAVQQVCGGAECFNLVTDLNRSLKKQSACHIINGTESVLDFIILWRGVWA